MKHVSVRFLILLLVLLVVAFLSVFMVGPIWVPLKNWLPIFSEGLDPAKAAILWDVRLPRVLLAILLGAGLGCAGAGYQGLFRNALADPFVIGASSGAALGVTLANFFNWRGVVWGGLDATYPAALIGALAIVALVYAIASVGRDVPTISLLLAGVAVSSFIGAIVSLVMFMQNRELAAIFSQLMGSLSGRGWNSVTASAPLIVLGSGGLWLLARPLDCLTFGEETTASLGFNLARLRALVILAASLATAAAVAAGGIIGFVGLIAPHIARLFMRTSRHWAVLPASCLTGALLLLVADDAARTILEAIARLQPVIRNTEYQPNAGELPVGVITALLGGPFFLYLLRTRRYYLERRA